jgi:hypothetical protein
MAAVCHAGCRHMGRGGVRGGLGALYRTLGDGRWGVTTSWSGWIRVLQNDARLLFGDAPARSAVQRVLSFSSIHREMAIERVRPRSAP